MNEATALGFPSIRFHTEIMGHIWDSSVYAGTRRFHEAKGFDPESQDLARHLGQPLYQLSSEVDFPFAYGKSSVFQPNPSVRLMVISPQVDDENFYSEEEVLNLDDSKDVRSSASVEEDG
jgi:hypothetical protein